mmetsp:Transcript_95098/g.188392  ORF Transcript_95098/g.188392 Transcript_95098/m.188392 type:complete len:542 (+) Transcript_95098:17-1642(+)
MFSSVIQGATSKSIVVETHDVGRTITPLAFGTKLLKNVQSWNLRAETPTERVEAKVGKIAVARYHKKPHSIEDDYRLTSTVLGKGHNGAVRLAVSRSNEDNKYAVKSLILHGRTEEQRQRLVREMEIFLSLDHPRIARLFHVYESEDRLDLVMECMEGGELFKHLAKKKDGLQEEDAANTVWQMLLALNYLHLKKGIVHRDLKLENFLYQKDNCQRLKLIDFGFSKGWDPNSNKMMGLTCGTLSYMAPEVLKNAYTSQCDLWSLGVIAFTLLMGYMPFTGSARYQSMCIERGKYMLDPAKWNRLSAPAKDFLTSLLQVDQEKRITAQMALKHEWIATRKKEEQEIDGSVVDALRGFSRSSQFRRFCMSMMAWSLSYDERLQVVNYFTALDVNMNGHITRTELQVELQDKFHVSEEEVQQILDAMDPDQDEEICYSSFLAAMMSTKIKLHDEILMATFKKFDTDRKGYITANNLRQVLGDRVAGVKVKTLLTDLDLSQHNQISYPEFETYLRSGSKSMTFCSTKLRPDRLPHWLSCFAWCSV